MSFSFWLLTDIACGIRSDPEQFIVFLVVMLANVLCVVCLISIFKESSIWAINAGFYSGLLFLVCSQFCFPAANCHNFVRTSPAFVLSVLVMVLADVCFFFFYGGFKDWRRHSTGQRGSCKKLRGALTEHMLDDAHTEAEVFFFRGFQNQLTSAGLRERTD